MSKQVRLSDDEKKTLKLISKIAGVSEDTVKTVFLSTLITHTINYFDEEEVFRVVLPYLFDINIKHKSKSTNKGLELVLDIEAKESATLYNEIKSILNGDEPPTTQVLQDALEDIIETKMKNNKK